ncbi:MAG TPA: hypothetical protein VGZ22_14285 [Isosphaeraceae bacterium]|jgi:hypothetical protein|nr:hypothetical protein [Isosphaeraceae bacterium]
MAVEGELRLAWQAARDGRSGMRDALLTLAVADSGPADAVWADRAWKRLIAGRSDHLFARFASREQALAHPEVAARLSRIRAVFPPARVQRLLERAEVIRGTYTGRRTSLAVVVEELVGTDESLARTQARPPIAATKASPVSLDPLGSRGAKLPAASTPATAQAKTDDTEAGVLLTLYLTVLLAIAILLASTLKATEHGTKAA